MCDYFSYEVKMHYFFKNRILYLWAKIKKNKCTVIIMTKEGLPKLQISWPSGGKVLVLGCGHISHIGKIHYFFKTRTKWNTFVTCKKSFTQPLCMSYWVAWTLVIFQLISFAFRTYNSLPGISDCHSKPRIVNSPTRYN